MNSKGQVSIEGIVLSFVSGLILLALLPTMSTFIEGAQNVSDATTSAVIGLIPFILVIVWMISAIRLTVPIREERFG